MPTRPGLIIFAFLAACSPANDTAPPQAPPVETASDRGSPNVAVATLVGEYRVAGIDGAAIDAPFGLALSIWDNRITFDAPCGGFAWDYRLDGTRFATTRAVSPDPACLARVRIHHLVLDLAGALDAVTRAERTPSNGIELSGADRSVTLYSQ